jgi:kynureninase
MPALRAKSELLTGYLEYLIDAIPGGRYELITPRVPADRGCQLSIRTGTDARRLSELLKWEGAIVDFRYPDVIRVAPVPMYNTFEEMWRFAKLLEAVAAK